MSREDGFQIADLDSSYFEDAKLRSLWRVIHDEGEMARAVCIHLSVLLASWRQGDRVTADEAAPLWITTQVVGGVGRVEIGALIQAGLLDLEGRIPEASFDEWFGSAEARRNLRRAAGRAGGQASVKQRSSKRQPKVKQPLTDAEPDRPSVPSVPTVPTESVAREGLPHLDATVASEWEKATGRSVLSSGDKVMAYLDDACRRLPVYEVCAGIIRARKQFNHVPEVHAMHGALLRVLDPFLDAKKLAASEREREQSAASRRGTESTLRRLHDQGSHADEPHPVCPSCREAAVTA